MAPICINIYEPQQVSEDIILAQAFVNLVRDRRLDRYRTMMPLVFLQTFDQLSFVRQWMHMCVHPKACWYVSSTHIHAYTRTSIHTYTHIALELG
jgi:hypothetical protein